MFDTAAAVCEVCDLRDGARKATLADVDLLDDDTLLASTLAASEARAALDAAEGHLLAELERRQVCDRELGLSTVSWLADRTHGARGPITGRVKTATRLRVALGEVDQALAEGRVTADHARALGDAVANPRIADQITDLQHDLIELAGECPFRVWRAHVARLVELLDQDSGYDPNTDLRRNKLRITPLGADHVKIEGELVGETAAVVAQALNRQADRVYRRFVSDHAEGVDDVDVPSRATCLALALADLCRQGQAVDPTNSKLTGPDITVVLHTNQPDTATPDDDGATPEPADRDTPDDDTADTPSDGCHHDNHQGTGRAEDDPSHRSDGDPPAAPDHDMADHDAADGDPPDGDPPEVTVPPWVRLTTTDGLDLDLGRYEHLLCDAAFHAVLVDSLGVPLDMGRTVRLATPAQRRAIAVRDQGCVFPGCDAPPGWCQLHHVVLYDKGGPTDLANMAPQCNHHHAVSHRKGWTMVANADHTFTWTTPSGRKLHSQRRA